MNKIAAYLNEHILGEVSSLREIRRQYSTDGSILTIVPEIVMFPASTNDIRKTARFAWQLAEKGHVMPITVRGGGTDETGAAIGKGMIIDLSKHLDKTLHVAPKDKVIHVQAGAKIRSINEVLQWHGLDIGTSQLADDEATIGGWLASDTSVSVPNLVKRIDRLEVVLANGDVIEVSKQSKRDVNRKKGLQTLEGEIYRKIDAIIEDNTDLIKSISDLDSVGYSAITQVKGKDGSIDLTPLFIGSQGTLGVISEVVMRAKFFNKDEEIIIAPIATKEVNAEILDGLFKLEPSILGLYDGHLFVSAEETGKKYPALDSNTPAESVLVVAFNDYSDRARKNKIKKASKLLSKHGIQFKSSLKDQYQDLAQVQRVATVLRFALTDAETMVSVVDGSVIPSDRRSQFLSGLTELETKLHVKLPIYTNILSGAVSVFPILRLNEVSDKQRVFRLMNEYGQLVASVGGSYIGTIPEGRIKANAAWGLLDDDTQELYTQIKSVFDPYGVLNPDIKQPNDLKNLIAALKISH